MSSGLSGDPATYAKRSSPPDAQRPQVKGNIALSEARLIFNLANEPAYKYSLAVVADRAPDAKARIFLTAHAEIDMLRLTAVCVCADVDERAPQAAGVVPGDGAGRSHGGVSRRVLRGGAGSKVQA